MNRYFITAVCVLAVLCRCSFAKDIDTTAIPQEIKLSAKELASEPVRTGFKYDTLDAPFMLTYNDSCIICINVSSETPGDKLLKIYTFNNAEPIYTAVEFGRGQGHVLSAQPYIHGDTLILHDVIKDCITIVDLRRAISDSGYSPDVIGIDFWTNQIMPYKDRLLYLSPYWTDDQRVSKQEAGDKFLVTGPGFTPGWEDGKYLTLNISAGILISNKEKDRILYFDRFDDLLEVYDYSLNIIRKITGPDNVQPVFTFPKNIDENNIPMQSGGFCNTYLCACSDGSDVYAAYLGMSDDSDSLYTYLINFDWDGNYKGAYRINGVIYYYMTYSDGYIYAAVTDNNGITRLTRFAI